MTVHRVNLNNIYIIDAISQSNKTPEERQKYQEAKKSEKMSTLHIYACCIDKSH